MTTRLQRGLLTAASLFGWCLPAVVHAAEGVELLYSAPKDCPDRAGFTAAVEQRGASFLNPPQDSRGQLFEVQLERRAEAYHGTLTVRDTGQHSSKRGVDGDRCEAVVDALAVMAAIALRPEQPDGNEEAAASQSSGSVSSTARDAVDTAAPIEPRSEPRIRTRASQLGATARGGEAKGVETEQAGDGAAERPTPRLRGHSVWGTSSYLVEAGEVNLDAMRSVSILGGATWGLIPSVMLPRYDLAMHNASFLRLPGGIQRLFMVSRVRVSALGRGRYESADTTTTIQGWSFGMDLCVTPTFDSGGWVVLACVEYGGGILDLDTNDGDGKVESKSVGFGTVGIGGEVQYNLSSLFHIGARVGWDAYLGDITAERRDGSQLFKASINTLTVGAGLGVHF